MCTTPTTSNVALICTLLVACADPSDDRGTEPEADVVLGDVDVSPTPDVPESITLSVVTFNTGSGAAPPSAADNAGFGPEQAEASDEWYGNGLAFESVVADTTAYFGVRSPDIVAFQEIFWSGACPDVPSEERPGFICETWAPGDPTVANLVLGASWSVACHRGSPDKCVGLRSEVGTIVGCDDPLCLDVMEGEPIEGCGGGARAGAIDVELVDGSTLRVVSVHGNSGFEPDDAECRTRLVERVFDGSDGVPALISDRPTIVLGDLNTDPGRIAAADPSAARWNEEVAEHGFRFASAIGEDAEPTYVFVNIDHALVRGLSGGCEPGGPVTDIVHFDHVPIECELVVE